MAIPREIRTSWNSDNEAIERILKAASKDLKPLLPLLQKQLELLPTDAAGRLQTEVSIELVNRILKGLGLDGYEQTLVSALQSANQADFGIFEALGFQNLAPSKRAVALAFQTNAVKNQFAKIKADLAFALSNRLQEMVLIPQPFSQVAKSLAGQLNLVESRAATLLNTSLAAFQTELARQAVSDVPTKDLFYIYVGPDDSKTRGFCHVLEGLAIPAALLPKLDNGTRPQLPFELFRGGYNCRHSLVPATRAYVELKKIPVATLKHINKANNAAKRKR